MTYVLACSKHRPVRLHQQEVLRISVCCRSSSAPTMVTTARLSITTVRQRFGRGHGADELRLGRDVRRVDPQPTARGVVRDLHVRVQQGAVEGDFAISS
jgi:hypothetical protein